MFFTDIPNNLVFDVIVYADVLEHVDDPTEVLAHHHTLLEDDGIIIGAIPNGFGPFEIESYIDRSLKITTLLFKVLDSTRAIRSKLGLRKEIVIDTVPYNSESGHLHFFSRRKFLETLSLAGFDNVCLENGVFMGANLSSFVLGRSKWFLQFNGYISTKLPSSMVSTWYFSAKNN